MFTQWCGDWSVGSDLGKHEFIGQNRMIDPISYKFHRGSQAEIDP